MQTPPSGAQPEAAKSAGSASLSVGGNSAVASGAERASQLLSSSRVSSDGSVFYFLLAPPSEAPDVATVRRVCIASSPSSLKEVTLFHAPPSRLVAVAVPQSLATSSAAAAEIIKLGICDWEKEVNASLACSGVASASGDEGRPQNPSGAVQQTSSPTQHAAEAPTFVNANSNANSNANTVAAAAGHVRSVPPPATTTGQPSSSSSSSSASSSSAAAGAPCTSSSSSSAAASASSSGQSGVGGGGGAVVSSGSASHAQPSASSGQRPTLFNLLEALASDSVTSPEQRNSIRGIVTDFLNHDLPHSKVYTFIGAVVGHDVLHTIVRKLENEPGRLGVPDAGGLARIEKAFGLSKTTSASPPQPACNASSGAPSLPNVASRGAASAVQEYSQANAAGANAVSSRDEILRVIRRNLDSRRMPPQNSKDVFEKVRWIPVRRPLTPMPVFGHTLISFSNKAIFFGGTDKTGNGVSFRSASVINLNFFSSRLFAFCGETPCERDGHSTNGLTLPHSPGVILFGGLARAKFMNDVYILELDFKRWVRKHPDGTPPAPRDQHAASVFPAKTETGNWRDNSSENLSEFLFIFGGRTGNPAVSFHCLNDMWALHLPSNTWTEVQFGSVKPPPRYGFSMVWSEDLHLSLFGGEGGHNVTSKVSGKERILLEDLWHFKIKGISNEARSAPVVVGEWQQEKYEGKIGPRSHYSAIFITQRYQEPRAEPRTIERLMLISSGVTSVVENGRMRAVETDQINVYFFSKKQWCTVRPRYPADYIGDQYGARQRHVSCFFETQCVSRNARPPVPCLFIHGGFRKHQVLGDAWVLSLVGDDPYKGMSSQPSPTMGCLSLPPGGESLHSHFMHQGVASVRASPPWYQRDTHTPGLLWALCSQQRWALGAVAQLIDNAVAPAVGSRHVKVSFEETPDRDPMLTVQDDGHGLDYPTMNKLLRLYGNFEPGDRRREGYEYGCGFKMAYGRLASSCAIMSRTSGTVGIGMLSLELMGHCDAKEIAAPMCMWRLPNKELINRDPNNMADHRHHQRLLMTYTPFTTPSLLAEQINVLGTHSGSRLVFWDLRDDLDGLVEDGGDGMLYLSSAPDLVPSVASGSRGEAETTDSLSREEVEGRRALNAEASSGPESSEARADGSANAGNGISGEAESGEGSAATLNGRDYCRPAIDRESQLENRSGPHLLDMDEEGRHLEEAGSIRPKAATGFSSNASSPPEKAKNNEDGANANTVSARKTLPPLFPLWTCAKHSPDFCLATYLYWLHLQSPATIHVQGIALLPQAAALEKRGPSIPSDAAASVSEDTSGRQKECEAVADPLLDNRPALQGQHGERRAEVETHFEGGALPVKSLKVFLKKRLYACAELRYLFTPADHEAGCYALIGFLNDPLQRPSRLQPSSVCEAGILLYFKGRLIRKLECTFPDNPRSIDAARFPPNDNLFGRSDGTPPLLCRYPVTAVINVPDWMLPSLNKQEFLHENNKPFMKFKARCMKLLQEYLRRCCNPQSLKEWIDQRDRRLRDYQDAQRRIRNKRRLNEDLTDEEQPRRSPTPPITHSNSGAPIWTGQRGSNSGVPEETPPEPKRHHGDSQQAAGTDGIIPGSNGEEPAGEETAPDPSVVLKIKEENGPEAMVQDGIDVQEERATDCRYDGDQVDTKHENEGSSETRTASEAGQTTETWRESSVTPQEPQ